MCSSDLLGFRVLGFLGKRRALDLLVHLLHLIDALVVNVHSVVHFLFGGVAGLVEVKKMNEEIESPALAKEAKDAKSKARDEKVGELNTMQREINEFRQTREKQLQEQSVRMRGGIVDEINKIVEAKVKSENFDMVFDKSGPSLNGVPVVLSSRDQYEFTEEVIKALNKNKGKEEPAPAKAEPAKPADKPAKPADKPADKPK